MTAQTVDGKSDLAMSYRHSRTRKGRTAKTVTELRRLALRDARWCQRHGIPEAEAWQWDRHPDATADSPAWGGWLAADYRRSLITNRSIR